MNGKRITTIAVGIAISLAAAAPAFATTESVGGGTWKYGVGFTNWSDYHHPTKNHRSSVQRAGWTVRSDCTAPNYWSHASMTSGPSGNKAFWNNSCS
jgi:lactococcin 972 family bacteriocin